MRSFYTFVAPGADDRNPVKKIIKPMFRSGGCLILQDHASFGLHRPGPGRNGGTSTARCVVGEEEIAIQAAGVCGSDISGFLGHSALRKPPLVLGHELVGRRGDGRRVVANPLVSCGHCNACMSGAQNLCESWKLLGLGTTPGTFAEYVALPSAQVYDVPDSLTSEQAILAEPLANIVHMLRIVAPPPFFRFAIVGAGTMGAWHCWLGADRRARATGS